MGTISKDFSYAEFERSEKARQAGIVNVIATAEVRDNVKALVEKVLQPLRDAYGKPLAVNSGYRCPELNRMVNGAPSSQHLKGEAADIGCENPAALAQLAYGLDLPFDQMIIYPDFVHFSHRRNGIQRHQILYARVYTGESLKI
ncbi:MAG: D-Ala-D-Ala carboxypeptidase family metallohydrolase [Bacteroidales bacterium]|nr:D-Ala-D-Ala carboxypeptidase family metallohydrolase [Bacteroidales bacterium]